MKSEAAVVVLAALAQESRLALFRLLVKRGPEGYTPGEIIGRLDIPAPTLSFHLKTLSHAGLLSTRQEGRFIHCVADFAVMHRLLGFLGDNCCGGVDCTPAAIPSTIPETDKAA